jgi:hypothetical protein
MESDGARFSARRVASRGHEILDPQGKVIAWTVDEEWAAVIVGLLNRAEAEPDRESVNNPPLTAKSFRTRALH